MSAGDLQRIPTTDAPFYSETVALDGANYRLFFAYNQREDCWYLSIADALDNDLLNGVKLVCGIDLLARWHAAAALPAGQLVVMFLGVDNPPGLKDLNPGNRCELVYVATT